MKHNIRRNRDRQRAKWGGGPFHAFPRDFAYSQVIRYLGPYASKLLFDLLAQYSGFNNGDLSISWTILRKRGWRSKATLEKATEELLNKGVILRTRQGSRRQCHLYALTIYDIDECNGKHDVNPTSSPPRLWLQHEPVISIVEAQARFKKRRRLAQNVA